jgi:hypothetical protein
MSTTQDSSTIQPVVTDDGSKATTVQKRASLHERAVQAIASGEVAPTPRKTRKRAQKRSEPVHTHIVVDERVMMKARELIALGSYTRVEIVDNETVIVR